MYINELKVGDFILCEMTGSTNPDREQIVYINLYNVVSKYILEGICYYNIIPKRMLTYNNKLYLFTYKHVKCELKLTKNREYIYIYE